MPARQAIPLHRRLQGLPIVLIFVVTLALFMYTAPRVFLAPYIYTTFLSTLPPLILLASGLTFVIAAGEIDLSFPAVIAFSGFVFAILFKEYHLGWIAVIAALAAGMMIGLVNGWLIAVLGVPSLITTLGTQFLWSGLATVLSGGRSYALREVEASSIWQVMVGRIEIVPGATTWLNGISIQAVWTAAVVVFLWFLLNRHRFGEHALFLGDSNAVAELVGVNVTREKIKIFTLMGALGALAALFLTLENKNFFGNQGQGYLLTAIAAVLIGGTSIFGGRATLIGAIFGCFIIGLIKAGLVASGLTGAWVRTVQGLVFLAAIIFYFTADDPVRRRAFMARLGAYGRRR